MYLKLDAMFFASKLCLAIPPCYDAYDVNKDSDAQ